MNLNKDKLANSFINKTNKKGSMSEPQAHPNGIIDRTSQEEDRRYIQWGVPSSQEQEYSQRSNHRQYSDANQHLYINEKKQTNTGEDGRQYQTEYSQVSAIETGFKKLKSNQIEILKELKKQYEVLRNSSLDSRNFIQKKLTSESESNGENNSISNSDAQSSLKSKTVRSSQRHYESKQLKLATLEKKQLELMLSNSMKKIEELLHNEIVLKKSVIEMKSKLEDNKISESEMEYTIRKHKDSEDALHRIIEDLKRENESLKSKIKDLTITTSNAEGNLSIKELQLKKRDEKVKLAEEELTLEKNRYLSLELDLKKLRMEYQILQKSKNQQLSLLVKNRNSMDELNSFEKNNKIRKLEEELVIKEDRYNLLLTKINRNEEQTHKEQEKQYTKTLQKLLLTAKDDKSQQSNQSIALILTKLTELHSRPDHHLLSEIQSLKKELQIFKNAKTSEKINDNGVELQGKIRELQKIIDEQNIQKMYFMQDLKKLTRDYNEIKKQKEELARKNKDMNYKIERIEDENRRYRNQLDSIRNINIDLTESQHQNKNLMGKLQHFNLKEIELTNMKEQLIKQGDAIKAKNAAYEEQIRLLKRQLNQYQFKIFKAHEESELKINLLKLQHQNQVHRSQQQIEKLKKNYALEKSQIENHKIKLQTKIIDKEKQIGDKSQKLNETFKEKETLSERIRAEYEFKVKDLQERQTNEIIALKSNIDSLTEAKINLANLSAKYSQMQRQYMTMKQYLTKTRYMNEIVDHLWEVKQTEYTNINEILKTLKS